MMSENECIEEQTNIKNPFLSAKRSWNTHVGSLIREKKVWQVVAMLNFMIAVSCVAGLSYVGHKQKYIPLVVQQDNMGNTLSVTRADKVMLAKKEDFRYVATEFIQKLRQASTDIEIQRQAVIEVFDYLHGNDLATSKVGEYFDKNPSNNRRSTNPFVRVFKYSESVTIDINAVVALSNDTWQIDWAEHVRNLDGTEKEKPSKMRALVTLYQNQDASATSESQALKNPHFIYVKDFNISKIF